MLTLFPVSLYFSLAFAVALFSYKKQTSSESFLLGSRSLNYWLTALAAHASDMSNWLFMAYPAGIFISGVPHAWVAIGLIVCMWLNWQLIAPKIRILTEKYQTLTLSGFFEKRLRDSTGALRYVSGALCFFFYIVYLAAGLTGLGVLAESLFGLSYQMGITCGIIVVISYVFIGGYVMLAWLDLFQGLFLLLVLIAVPLFVVKGMGSLETIATTIQMKALPLQLFPDFSLSSIGMILSLSLGWGLGYLGQPHIITKFMGIRSADQIKKSKAVGMSWMCLSLLAATSVGLVGIAFFQQGLADPERVFIDMVRTTFSPFFVGFILCAIVAAIINVMSSQMLVLTSILSEDFYRHFFPKRTSERELVWVSRFGILIISCFAFFIASGRFSSIASLVEYAWAGLGASFGPLLLFILYSKKTTRLGAWIGMSSGGLIAALWPIISEGFPFSVHPLLPGFVVGLVLNKVVSHFTYRRSANTHELEAPPTSTGDM